MGDGRTGAPMGIDKIEQCLDDGASLGAVAAAAGVSTRTIRNWLLANGRASIAERRVARHAEIRLRLLSDEVWLRTQHLELGRAAGQIARDAQASTSEVHAAFARFDIARVPKHPGLTPEALRDAFAAGETVSSIARSVGIDRSGIRQRMRRFDIRNPHHRPMDRPEQLDDAAWLRQQFSVDALTIREVAARLSVNEVTVRRAMRRHGVEPTARPAGQQLPPGGIDGDWLKMQYVQRHRTLREIALDSDVSIATMQRAVNHFELVRTRLGRTARALENHDWLRGRYLDDGATANDIAAALNCSTWKVRSALTQHGIRRRPVSRGLFET